ncbi:type 1 fimbria pilin [Buttiauxella sp. BIGb0471]|uniref:fimbrial protein n=1 Tax=Buttiauxella sp. BIGb0471 TaxID=2940597 RepID=UPI00216A6223|nr:fimbrial protein [Buttiauxella sp. BIGb0471]MCS3601922.1 type 1 fimbria pilin [Buttiauxella sp. BIGb0471]
MNDSRSLIHFIYTGLACVILVFTTAFSAHAVDDNLKFGGTLVSEPCELDPATTDFEVDFRSVVQKSLYLYGRTPAIPFTINLINCDIALANSVTMTFTGSESTNLPGLLAVTGTATGIAIGMEDQAGIPIPFNEATKPLALEAGTTSITFMAYVEGEPDAIANQNIVPGTFTAIATFEIAYP